MATQTTTQTPTGPAIPVVHISELAAKKIIALLAKDGVSPEVGGLRVGVQGGGCSGLSYAMRLDTQARDRDKVFEEFGARIFVDPKSLLFLNGTILEYEDTLMRRVSSFKIPMRRGVVAAAVVLRRNGRIGFSLFAGDRWHR